MNEAHSSVGSLETLLPRSNSASALVFTMSCYAIAITAVTNRVISVLGYWPTIRDPQTHVLRPEQLGIDDSSDSISLYFLVPFIESLVLIGVIELMRRFKFAWAVQVLIAAAMLGLGHAIHKPIWGLAVMPAFLAQAVAYVYWRYGKASPLWSSVLIVFSIHFFCNILPFLRTVQHAAGVGKWP